MAQHETDTAIEAQPEARPEGTRGTFAPPALTGAARLITGMRPNAVLALQRAAGNAAVATRIARERGDRITVADAAGKLRAARARGPGRAAPAGAHRRLPSPDELKRIYTSGTTPQVVVEAAVRRALERMDADFDLRTDAADVMSKLFPAAGTFDESAWAGVLGTDTDDVYTTAADAETKLRPADKAKLDDVARAAADEIDKAMADAQGLKDVFGANAALAKARYAKAKAALKRAMANSDTAIDTDYNRDDPQVGLGGWALFSAQHIHLTGDVAEVKDRNAAIITLIHECAHLSDPAVEDLGYYKSDGFESMSEADKVNNAAHYEELPARSLGISQFASTVFTPGQKNGLPVTFEDEVRRAASEYLRKAWDAAVDAHQFVRNVAKEMNAKPASNAFRSNKASLIEISKMEQLTIHQQVPAPTEVTNLDLVLSEGVAHATVRIKRKAFKQAVTPGAKKSDAVNAVIDGAIADYGHLLGSPAADRKLIDWLVGHYRRGF